jgi:hypothetical protein
MSIFNRRNALLGWGVWQLTKVAAKRKAKEAVPGAGDHAGLNKSAMATIAAGIVAALFFWRKKSEESSSTVS